MYLPYLRPSVGCNSGNRPFNVSTFIPIAMVKNESNTPTLIKIYYRGVAGYILIRMINWHVICVMQLHEGSSRVYTSAISEATIHDHAMALRKYLENFDIILPALKKDFSESFLLLFTTCLSTSLF